MSFFDEIGEEIFPNVRGTEQISFITLEFEGEGDNKLDIIGTTYLPEFSEVAPAITVGLLLFYFPLFIIQGTQESKAKTLKVIAARSIFLLLILSSGILEKFYPISLSLEYIVILQVLFVWVDNLLCYECP